MTLIFLKLGGSLITDKTRPYSARLDRLDALSNEIASAIRDHPDIQLVLGHGSGSFGHEAASHFDIRNGVLGQQSWAGFAEVWYQASALNRMVVESLHKVHLPVISISPLASVIADDNNISTWATIPIQRALSKGLLPIIHGDVVFDNIRGGTILSTEELFVHLAHELHPQRILLSGLETGVWADFPSRRHLLKEITPENLSSRKVELGAASGTDVTGGMASKVAEMLGLITELPALEIFIFSGEQPGNIYNALCGKNPGTHLHC
jgi:isopentenyl phosphate kinase